MRREMCLHGSRYLNSTKSKALNRPLLAPRIKQGGGGLQVQRNKRKRLLKERELKKHHSEIQEVQVEKWLESTGRFPRKRWKIEQKRTLKTWFEGMDKDKSGEIDVDELADPLMSTGLAKTMSEVSKLVRTIDADRSSGIDFQEFLDVLKKDAGATNDGPKRTKAIQKFSCSGSAPQTNLMNYKARKKKLKKAASNPIIEFTKKQYNEHMDLRSVLSHERRKLLLDATMMQADRREKALDQINSWRSEMKDLAGASKFRKLHDISNLIHHLETDRAEKENFIATMKGMIEKLQKEDNVSPLKRNFLPTPAHRALLKERNMSMLRRDNGRNSIGHSRRALVYPRTRNPSLPSLVGVTHRRGVKTPLLK